MEQRKLIRLGNSSFAIALPKDWVDKSGLKKGDKIFVEKNSNGEITISSEFKKINGNKKTIINIDGKDKDKIRREFTSDYIRGNSVFEFAGSLNKEKSDIIKSITADFISCEIIEDNEKNVIVKDFFNLEEMNIINFIKRIDNNIKEMFDIIILCVEKNKVLKKDMEEIVKIDLDINKFYFLTSRILMLGLDNPALLNLMKMEPKDLFNNWWLSFHLEHAGDNLKAIAGKIKSENIDVEIKKELLPVLTELRDKYKDSLKIFYSKDKEESYKIMEDGKRILKLCEKLAENKNSFLSLIGEKLKEVNNASYQVVKMVSYLKE